MLEEPPENDFEVPNIDRFIPKSKNFVFWWYWCQFTTQ